MFSCNFNSLYSLQKLLYFNQVTRKRPFFLFQTKNKRKRQFHRQYLFCKTVWRDLYFKQKGSWSGSHLWPAPANTRKSLLKGALNRLHLFFSKEFSSVLYYKRWQTKTQQWVNSTWFLELDVQFVAKSFALLLLALFPGSVGFDHVVVIWNYLLSNFHRFLYSVDLWVNKILWVFWLHGITEWFKGLKGTLKVILSNPLPTFHYPTLLPVQSDLQF